MEENSYLTQSLKSISASKFNHTGILTFRDTLYVLNNSVLLSNLTKLQVIILMSGATILSGNKVDYYLFVPVVAVAVEELSEDENFRQRVEIARTADIFFDINDIPKVRAILLFLQLSLLRLYLLLFLLFYHLYLFHSYIYSYIFFDINDIPKVCDYADYYLVYHCFHHNVFSPISTYFVFMFPLISFLI